MVSKIVEKDFQKILCTECDNGISEEGDMEKHMKKDYITQINFEKCENITEKKNKMNRHMEKDQDKSAAEVKSTESSLLKSFESKSEENISSNEAEFECNICDGEFIDFEALKHHNDTHHKTSFQCQQCEEDFMNSEDLKTHQDLEHNANPHERTFFNPYAS